MTNDERLILAIAAHVKQAIMSIEGLSEDDEYALTEALECVRDEVPDLLEKVEGKGLNPDSKEGLAQYLVECLMEVGVFFDENEALMIDALELAKVRVSDYIKTKPIDYAPCDARVLN